MPAVSFVMAIYKRRFLKESIDSVLSQTCRDFELVMVDDHSPENLREVIDSYPWGPGGEALQDGGTKWTVDGIPVRYYRNSEDIGEKDLVAAWNHAMGFATAEWCVLASDDDIYAPRYLEKMLKLREKYPSCELFHSRLAVIDADGKWTQVGEERLEFETQIQMAYFRGARRFDQRAPDFMFKKSALDGIGGFVNFPLAWYSDDATWMALARHGCACSPEVLFRFRQSGENISSVYGKSVDGKLKAAGLFKAWFREFAESFEPQTDEDRCLAAGICDKVDAAVDNLSVSIVAKVKPFGKWLGLLRRTPMSRSSKLKCVYARFRFVAALRLLLPRLHLRKNAGR